MHATLSSQTSVDTQTQLFSTDVVIRQTTKAGLSCKDRRPDIASVHLEITTADKQEREQGIKSACTDFATYEKPSSADGKTNSPRCAGPVLAPLQNRCKGKLCENKDVQGSVISRSLLPCRCNVNSFHTMYLQKDCVSHWTCHCIVFHGMRFSALTTDVSRESLDCTKKNREKHFLFS